MHQDRPMRVMAVEDNPADVELLRMALDRTGAPYEMSVVSDGAEAIEQIRQMRPESTTLPDVIVLDLNLPKYGGLEVLGEVRSHPALASTPVTILSSSSSPRERSSIQVFSRVLYLTKPLDLDQYLGIGTLIREFLMESRGMGGDDESRRL